MAVFNDGYNAPKKDESLGGLHLVDEEKAEPKFKGEIRDTVRLLEDGKFEVMEGITVEGKAGHEVELPVGYNLVVDSCSKLIAALIKNHTGYKGALYWEVGKGQSSWNDATPPSPSASDVSLNNPFYRKAIQASDITFIDANSNPTSTVTNRIQITVTFGSTEANDYLREFGLFGGGGDATTALGSGLMINRKTHGVIYKTSGIELTRTLRLTF